MFKEMTPGKKKLLIIGGIVLVLAIIIFFIVRARKKNKKATEALVDKPSNFAQTPDPRPQQPKMQIVPDEDRNPVSKTEPALSVQEVIPDKKEVKEQVPGTLGAVNQKRQPPQNTTAPKGSALPPEFMQDANNPNAGV